MKRKHRRLWPLLFLPVAGLFAGFYVAKHLDQLPFAVDSIDPVSSAGVGLLVGTGAMVVIAAAVLAHRIAQRRFTIGAIMITIAVIAVLLAGIRSLFH